MSFSVFLCEKGGSQGGGLYRSVVCGMPWLVEGSLPSYALHVHLSAGALEHVLKLQDIKAESRYPVYCCGVGLNLKPWRSCIPKVLQIVHLTH